VAHARNGRVNVKRTGTNVFEKLPELMLIHELSAYEILAHRTHNTYAEAVKTTVEK
jgi:hypothetical protein